MTIRKRSHARLTRRHRGLDPYAEEDAATGGAKAARVRRGPPLKVVFLIGLLLVLIVAVVGGILLWQRVSDFNRTVSTAPAASSALFGPLGGEERVNVVLIGYGGREHRSGNFLADSIQILSIDPEADTTTIIPIPRDFWIEGLAAMPGNGKVNEAFAIGHEAGGVEEAGRLTTEVLSEVTGLEIEHWMAIDFEGFREIIDSVGGVTIRNPRAFEYTWNEDGFQAGRFPYRFDRGELHLDGAEALSYARARYTNKSVESSDFARSVRQQRILGALRSEVGGGGFGSIGPGLAMMDALEGRMKTNLSAIDLFLLSGHLEPDHRIELKEGRILEATSSSTGQYILVVIGRTDGTDYGPLQRYLDRQLAKPIPASSPRASGGS